MSEPKPNDKEATWAERCSYKLDLALSRLDRIVSMLFHTKAVLTSDEAAMYLGITTGHLYRMVRKFNIPHTRPTNGKIYFRKHELDNWIGKRIETCGEVSDSEDKPIDAAGVESPVTDMHN